MIPRQTGRKNPVTQVMSRIVIVIAALAGLLGAPTMTQAQPADPSAGLVSGPVSSSAERAELAAFATWYVQQLGSNDIAQREAAREKLASQTSRPAVSDGFRFAFTKALMDAGLMEIITGADAHASTNALRVVATLGSKDALDETVRLTSDPRMHIRLRAAAAAARILRETTAANSVPERQREQAVTRLAQATRRETDPLVLRRLFEAMAAMDAPAARLTLADALADVVKRLQSLSPDQAASANTVRTVDNLDIVLYRLYDSYLRDISRSEKESLGAALGPALGELYNLALTQWDQAQSSETAKEVYGRILGRTESFLQRIDTIARINAVDRPRTDPQQVEDYWRRGDKAQFQQHWNAWRGILQSNPYNMSR